MYAGTACYPLRTAGCSLFTARQKFVKNKCYNVIQRDQIWHQINKCQAKKNAYLSHFEQFCTILNITSDNLTLSEVNMYPDGSLSINFAIS